MKKLLFSVWENSDNNRHFQIIASEHKNRNIRSGNYMLQDHLSMGKICKKNTSLTNSLPIFKENTKIGIVRKAPDDHTVLINKFRFYLTPFFFPDNI